MKPLFICLISFLFLGTLDHVKAHVNSLENLGPVQHFMVKYKLHIEHDIEECRTSWAAYEIKDHDGQRAHVLASCDIKFTEGDLPGREGKKYFNSVSGHEFNNQISASFDGIKIKIKDHSSERSIKFENNMSAIRDLFNLTGGYVEIGYYHNNFTSRDLHFYSLRVESPAVVVTRSFPNFNIDDCRKNWVKSSKAPGDYRCRIEHFDHIDGSVSVESDRADITWKNNKYYFNVAMTVRDNYYEVDVSQYMGSKHNIPMNFDFHEWYINQVYQKLFDQGEDFKVDTMMPLTSYKAQIGEGAPMQLALYRQKHELNLNKCASNWISKNGLGFQNGRCVYPMNTAKKKLYFTAFDYASSKYDIGENFIRISLSSNHFGNSNEADEFTVDFSASENTLVDDFQYRDVKPFIERALMSHGSTVFQDEFVSYK